jgi:hypothetical protein
MGIKVLKVIFFTAIIIIVMLLNLFAFYRFSINSPGGNDSIPSWIGVKAWVFENINPYSTEVTIRGGKMVYGPVDYLRKDKEIFAYPFYTLFLYIPFIWMNFEWARAINMLLLEFSILLMIILSIKIMKWDPPRWLYISTIFFGLFLYYSVRTIILWQVAGYVALFITLALWGIKEHQDVFAGVCLAMASIKPQMVFFIIPIIFIEGLLFKRFKLSLSIIITLFILFALSSIFLPTWIFDMVNQMKNYTEYIHIGSPINIITHIMFPFLGNITELILIVLLIIWLIYEWFQVKSLENGHFTWTYLLTLVITNLIIISVATTNYLMMFPTMIFIFKCISNSPIIKPNLWVFLIQMIFLVGTWGLFLITVQGNLENWQMYLPFPIFVLLGLMIFRSRENLTSKNRTQ